MTDTGYYLYGIIKNMPLADNIPGIDEGAVLAISFHEIVGIVSAVSLAEFGEVPLKKNLESLDWVRDKVFGHERVIETVMKQTAVIPMKFCTIFNSRERILELLEKKHGLFTELLEKYSDKREWGGKVYCRKKPDVAITPTATGKEYLQMKKRQYELAQEYERRVNKAVDEIFKRINGLAELSRINRPTPQELLPYNDKEQVLNASFLVRETQEKKLRALADELAVHYGEEGLTLELAGPLPVYSFIESEPNGNHN